MKRTMRIMAAVITVLALLMIAATPVAAYPPPHWHCYHAPNPTFGGEPYTDSDIAAAADMLGLSEDDLETRLWAGETLSDIAKELGVDLTALRNAIEAARYQQLTGNSIALDSDAGETTTTALGGLNLRYGPGTTHGIYCTVSYGTTVYRTGNTKMVGAYEWSEITYNGRTLWAASMYLA